MRTPARALVSLVVGCAALVAGGCASRDPIDPATQTLLQRDVQTLTHAAAGRDAAAARAALATLNADLAAAHTAGKISDAKLAQVHAAVVKVTATLATQPAPPPKPTTPAGGGKGGDGKGGDGKGGDGENNGD